MVINHPYLLPPSTTIHGILPIQSECFAVFFHNLSPSFLWSTSWPGTLHFILHTFLHPIIIFFSQHMPICRNLFCCSPTLVSLSTLYLEFYLVASCHTSILPFSSLPSEVPPHFRFLQARSHFHATYCFAHNCCTISLSLSIILHISVSCFVFHSQ